MNRDGCRGLGRGCVDLCDSLIGDGLIRGGPNVAVYASNVASDINDENIRISALVRV